MSEQVQISDIDGDTFQRGYLRGVVSLRWPYSSSQHQISIQLADEDIRRRAEKGQVRLTFNGAAADALKTLPSLALLEIRAPSSSKFESFQGSKRDIDYKITFTGDVTVIQDGQATRLNSKPVAADLTPAKLRRTWQPPDLKRSAQDDVGLEDSWFSQDTPDAKRKKYSQEFRVIGKETPRSRPDETFQFQTPIAPVRVDKSDLDEVEVPSRPSSVQGEVLEHDTPRSNAHIHFSAPPTPRNVPYLSLESADEQEDLFRKLRASAPPKSEAGSSMVADEDDEAGNFVDDPNPTILETQSRIQEGILRRKISDDLTVLANPESISPPRPSRSNVAAYAVSENVFSEHAPSDRIRENSPSMTERGAAVQESVFRNKIQDSDEAESVHSVKSSVLVEPAAASIDGSVLENVERSMLDQQASVQETLFREKLDHPNVQSSLSLLGQPQLADSNLGDEATNLEPSMLQQQASVQENIFRDKVGSSDQLAQPASLDHMEVHETTTRLGLAEPVDPLSSFSSLRTISEFHDRADIETAINAAVGDEMAEAEAREFLKMELEAEPEERLHDFYEFGDEKDDIVAFSSEEFSKDKSQDESSGNQFEPIQSDPKDNEFVGAVKDGGESTHGSSCDLEIFEDEEIDIDEMFHDDSDDVDGLGDSDENEKHEDNHVDDNDDDNERDDGNDKDSQESDRTAMDTSKIVLQSKSDGSKLSEAIEADKPAIHATILDSDDELAGHSPRSTTSTRAIAPGIAPGITESLEQQDALASAADEPEIDQAVNTGEDTDEAAVPEDNQIPAEVPPPADDVISPVNQSH